jgi:signal transduction histidine kinase
MDKWQSLIDALAKLMDVPSALVMKVKYPYLKAFIRSNTEDNPIPPNYEEEIFGTYCEYTISSKRIHEVPNALKDQKYKNKPGLEENNLIFYLGFPLEWPTGDIFGTICILDQKERNLIQEKKEVMRQMKVSIDAHLELIYKNELLKQAREKIKRQRDDLKLLTSTVRHDIANNLTYIMGYLQLKQKNSELPPEFADELLPYLRNSIESIKNIKKLEILFTKEKFFKEIHPEDILEKIKEDYFDNITIKGSCMVKADEFLELLLKELIRNVVKHTEIPKIEIVLTEDEKTARIKIQDYGLGLPENIVESHFKNQKQQRELKGLTIVEKIMERYSGNIIYEKNDKGGLFELIWYKDEENQ